MASISIPTMSLVMMAVSVAGSVASGVMQQQAAAAQAKQYEFNAKSEKVAADQGEVARRSDLLGTLSAIDAVRTARGLDPSSPTGLAIAQNESTGAERGIGTERLNADAKAQSDLFAASAANSRGTASLLGGFLEAGKTLNTFGENNNWWG